MHYHGYIGMEAEAVKMISDWIKSPASQRSENLAWIHDPVGIEGLLDCGA